MLVGTVHSQEKPKLKTPNFFKGIVGTILKTRVILSILLHIGSKLHQLTAPMYLNTKHDSNCKQ